MANLPSQHPHLSLHLSDRALTPLITSARTQYQLEALTSLSHGALSAHESALRLGLGTPQRIIVEHANAGPVILQSFLRADIRPSSSATTAHAPPSTFPQPPSAAAPNGLDPIPPSSPSTPLSPTASPTDTIERRLAQLQLQSNSSVIVDDPALEAEDANAPPTLVGVVISPSADEARDARRAAARLERVGREIQARWAEAQVESDEDEDEGGGGGSGSGAGAAGDAGD
ncbi:uncharacterized protein GGS22DRAFT_161628 [Annulohypoxylon maeteangense]|uniref:uncharacterized protein n=1 Tax=Annulohypoxylon maeteangense TaxID=1927788 RepID=UPI00200824E0|nr:uncharacterized protein GGS22DRAFT_161628 [Annulohypoxylon maeteangense]KAI0885687.1 hypothetical protein GGS22DRAFT_161628 [Annulohypoxylon maeteangense]